MYQGENEKKVQTREVSNFKKVIDFQSWRSYLDGSLILQIRRMETKEFKRHAELCSWLLLGWDQSWVLLEVTAQGAWALGVLSLNFFPQCEAADPKVRETGRVFRGGLCVLGTGGGEGGVELGSLLCTISFVFKPQEGGMMQDLRAEQDNTVNSQSLMGKTEKPKCGNYHILIVIRPSKWWPLDFNERLEYISVFCLRK